jgi:hypothetical protein
MAIPAPKMQRWVWPYDRLFGNSFFVNLTVARTTDGARRNETIVGRPYPSSGSGRAGERGGVVLSKDQGPEKISTTGTDPGLLRYRYPDAYWGFPTASIESLPFIVSMKYCRISDFGARKIDPSGIGSL